MALRNRPERFGGIAKTFHWLTLLLLIGSFTLGLSMVDMDLSPTKLKYYSWHKWIGVTVFALTVLRLGWRIADPPPPPPTTMPRWQGLGARASHGALYLILLVMPLTGWVMSSALDMSVVYLGIIPIPDLVAPDRTLGDTMKVVHQTLAWLLLTVFAVHVLAALYHHLILRDDVLRRMLPWHKVGAD